MLTALDVDRMFLADARYFRAKAAYWRECAEWWADGATRGRRLRWAAEDEAWAARFQALARGDSVKESADGS